MRIVITGIGIISAIGTNRTECLDALLHKQSGIDRMQYLSSDLQHLYVGEVKRSNAQLQEELCIADPVSRTTLLGIKAAREALEQAQVKEGFAFINGTTVGGMDTSEIHYKAWLEGQDLPYLSLHSAGSCTAAIANALGGVNYYTTPSTACSSALNSIIIGAHRILTGHSRYVLAGGAECLTDFHTHGFNSLMILSDKPCQPFDADRKGLNLGEGAAYLLMESEESAISRNAPILAYVSGFANACDAFHQTSSSADGEGAYLAMSKALAMAEVSPEKIDYINAHGTATENNDASEIAALKRIFPTLPPFSSTKAFTGHTTSASGSIETALCILAMQNSFIPANLNFHTAVDKDTVPAQHTLHQEIHYVLCNSFGFGGNDSSLIISNIQGKEFSSSQKNPIEISIKIEDSYTDYKRFLNPMEARRMTASMRLILTNALLALQEAGIQTPDAIITATHWGCIHNTRLFLDALTSGSELKPSEFMLSTHNTVASMIAQKTGCHGYNCTFSQDGQSLDDALEEAEALINTTEIRNVLVLQFDEEDDIWNGLLSQTNQKLLPHTSAMVVTRK